MYKYQFPPIYARGSVSKQMMKVLEEADEVKTACTEETIIEETFDLIHACETLLRKFDQDHVKKQYDLVIKKNEERGYY